MTSSNKGSVVRANYFFLCYCILFCIRSTREREAVFTWNVDLILHSIDHSLFIGSSLLVPDLFNAMLMPFVNVI